MIYLFFMCRKTHGLCFNQGCLDGVCVGMFTNGLMVRPKQEPVHKLAWTLDAALKDRALDARRLDDLRQFLERAQPHHAAHGARPLAVHGE